MKKINKFFPFIFIVFSLLLAAAQNKYEPSFPRLGLWWPSTEEQPLEKIARYDWVALFPYEHQAAIEIKKINPNIKLLTSTNACELGYNPEKTDGDDNPLLRKIPAEWFLTQVGSVLREDIDDRTTNIPVEKVKLLQNGKEIELFVVDEAVLIEGESMLVKYVDDETNTLEVERGFIRPSSAHKKGARIAAHISFWYNTWVMNLSIQSPKASLLGQTEQETWADYNARHAIGLLKVPVWDGILIDRSDANESWLIGNSTARTIDPNQSNRLLTDYNEFDKAWNEGLIFYEQTIRKAVGHDKLIVVNWGMPNVNLLNGNTFEGFPRDDGTSYQSTWNQTMFGNVVFGSVLFWNQNALKPNLTLIQTYEDDDYPQPTFRGEYDNPCEKPGFQPNYQKMRFGLASALLADGYFSYEMNTNGHASLCLMWFDEYDNHGNGRGYLGMPLKPAERIIPVFNSPNLLSGGDFEKQSDLQLWSAWAKENIFIKTDLDNTSQTGKNSILLEVDKTQGVDWEASFSFDSIVIDKKEDYTLTFWAKADKERNISIWLQQNRDPWEVIIDFGKVHLHKEWQKVELSLPAERSEKFASLLFALGETNGKVWLDNITLQKGSHNLYWREFAHGLVIVNATSQRQHVKLPRAYKKIKGSQVPAVNNGALVYEVDLMPRDGLILLNP